MLSSVPVCAVGSLFLNLEVLYVSTKDEGLLSIKSCDIKILYCQYVACLVHALLLCGFWFGFCAGYCGYYYEGD
jgi:hypothetical protein